MAFGLPGWPGGDPDAIREVADAWDAVAAQTTSAVEVAGNIVHASFADLDGKTKTAYLGVWSTYAENQKKGAEGAKEVAKQLREVAASIEEAHTKYEHIMEGLAAAAAVGIVVGIFTFGIGSAVADTAAIGAAGAAIASLLEGLGVAIEATAVADAIGAVVGGAVVGTEFSVFLQEGESIGAGDGLTMVDFSDTAVAAVTGGLLAGGSEVANIVVELKSISGAAATILKGLTAADISAAGSVAGSELNGHGVGSLTDIILAAALGGAGSGAEIGLNKVVREVESLEAAGEDEARLALDFGALFKDDPDLLLAIKNDPFQSDDVRYLASQYHDLFEADPNILSNVPELATLLKQNPQEVAHVLDVNRALADVGRSNVFPPTVKNAILKGVATHPHAMQISLDGASDFVRDWVKSHREQVQELEKELGEMIG